jgi:hypothetical protein
MPTRTSPATSLIAQTSARPNVSGATAFAPISPKCTVPAIQLPLTPGHEPRAARLTITVTISETNVSANIKDAMEAVHQMSSVPPDPTEQIRSDVGAISSAVAPVIADVMAATQLESVLNRLDGFMKMADIVAEVCVAVLCSRLSSVAGMVPMTDSSVCSTGMGGCFHGI